VRRPAYRGRELGPGFCMELREPVTSMTREKHKWRNHEARVPTRGTGADRSVVATKVVMRLERRDRIRRLCSRFNWHQEEIGEHSKTI
jgi:hypothetical protein